MTPGPGAVFALLQMAVPLVDMRGASVSESQDRGEVEA